MKLHNHRHRKPDLLLVLVILVTLGVVLTTSANAGGSGLDVNSGFTPDKPVAGFRVAGQQHGTGLYFSMHPTRAVVPGGPSARYKERSLDLELTLRISW